MFGNCENLEKEQTNYKEIILYIYICIKTKYTLLSTLVHGYRGDMTSYIH